MEHTWFKVCKQRDGYIQRNSTVPPLWNEFTVITLTAHMRLQDLRRLLEHMNQEQILELQRQEWPARALTTMEHGNHPINFNKNYE